MNRILLLIARVARTWTLPISMSIGAGVYLLFYYTPALEGLSQWFAPIFEAILPLFMFLILYVTFCKVDFKKLAPVPWHWWMIVVQCILVGSITGAILFFGIRGKEQMTFWGAFSLIMQKVCLVLVVPMLLALLTKSLPQLRRFHQWLIHIPDLSFYLWGCSLMIVTGTTLRNIFHAGTSVLFLSLIGISGLVLCLFQYAVGRYIGRFFGTSIESGQALGQKNTAFAIWIAATYLHPLSTVGPGCYILWQNIINSIEIWKKGKYKA